MKKLISVILTIVLILSIILFWKIKNNDEKLYGLTIDDSWYDNVSIEEIVSSLKNFKVKPTVRIVMSKDTHPKEYIEIFREIHEVAYIMAEPVDSYEMNLYKDVESYRNRFLQSDKYLGKYVDIWEIGNEINGVEWIRQSDKLIIKKVMAAHDVFEGTDKKTAITFYYENPSHNRDMIRWIRENVSLKIRKEIDYAFISYYEDDNEGYNPDWQKLITEFQTLFPDSKIGIGECGNTANTANINSKIEMINKYYKMPFFTKNYIGGYFWWNYVADCIPHRENKIYKAIYDNFK